MSLRTYSFSMEWYVLTTGMMFCLVISIGCILIQSRSISWYTKKINCDTHKQCKKNNNLQRRTLSFLYMVYIMACLCSIQCFLCHISDTFPSSYYCEWGMPICVILYVGAKSFLYGFFIERAKATQNMIITNANNYKSTTNGKKDTNAKHYQLPNEIIFDYILPIYIFIYFWTFFILIMIYFRGKVFTINDSEDHDRNIKITGCLFYEFKQWMFILGAIIDVINSIGLLYLFLKPLYLTIDTHKKYLDSYSIQCSNSNELNVHINHSHDNNDNDREHEHEQEQDGLNGDNINFNEMVKNEINSEINKCENNKMDFEQEKNDLLQMITTIKINLLCTMLSTTSCIAFFLLMAFSQIIGIEQYLWFLGNIDLMINSLSTFIMLRPNRSYTSEIIFCGCFNWSCIKCINCKCKLLITILDKLSSSNTTNNHKKDPKDTTKQHVRVQSNEKIDHEQDHEHSAVSTDHLKQPTLKQNNEHSDGDRNRINKSQQQQPSY